MHIQLILAQHGFFSVSTVALHDMRLVESVGAEPGIQRANYKVIYEFSVGQGVGHLNPCIVQGPTVLKTIKWYTFNRLIVWCELYLNKAVTQKIVIKLMDAVSSI